MGRIVVKGGGKISGSRSKYVASSKISENEKRVRKLFSEVESELTYTQADNHLSGGKSLPRDNELLELIVSVHRDRYLRLGTTAEERESNFKNSIREGLSLLWEEMGVENVRYVAGLHQNTDAPHTHILIWRGAQNAETGKPQIINAIPRSWIYGTKKENSKIGKIFDEIFNQYSLPQLPKFTHAILSSENILLPARDTNAVRSESAINALIEQRYISPEIIESLQDSGAVYANRQGSITYVRRDGSGVITGYESGTGFGKADDKGFFYIGEPKKATHFVVVENPKELLSLLELTSHRNLAEVCFVAADRKQSPKAFTELLKSRANENSMRIVWAFNETENKESIAPFEKLQNELLESRKPNAETTLEFYTFSPKLKYGKTWHQQILWRELPGQAAALRTEVRRVGTTELLIENSDVAEAYEMLSNEVFSRLTVEKIGDEFVVYDRENQTEKGRYQWELFQAENNFTITSINGIPALTNFKENELHFTDEVETLNLLEDYSLRLQNQNFLYAIDTADDKYELESQPPRQADKSDQKTDKSEVIETELKPAKEVLSRAEAFERAKEITRKLKEIPLEEILSMHGLGLVKDKERQEWVYKDSGNKFKIKVTGNLFSDRYDDRRGGKGAIKLWEHLNNCDFPTARSEMFEHFGATYVPSEKTSKLKTVETAIETEKKTLVLPPPNKYNEEIVRTYLIEERKMSAAVVDYLMDDGDVYANSYKSVVFLHRNLVDKSITGASWRATQGTKRQDVAGSDKNKGWFHLGNFETADRFIITESPIEAISYFELHKHDDLSGTLILASGGNHVSLNLFRLIEEKAGQNAEIVMAFNNDKGGQNGYLNTLEKTGSYVLLRHKNAYLAGEIETVEFTGIISLEVPVSDDWNDDLKQYREESFAEAEIEHIVEEVNQNAEPFLIQISTKTAGKKHTLYLDEAFADRSDFLINAINNGFFADYTNALIETEELASIDDFDIAVEKDTNAVLMVTDSHLAGIEKAVLNERQLIESSDFKLAELYGKGIEKFLRRSDERYTLSLQSDAIESRVDYTIESLASEDVFYLSVPTDTGSLWSVGINRRIEREVPPNNFRFEKHVFEGNLRDSLKFIQDQDGKVFDEIASEQLKTKTFESNPQGILAEEGSITERAGGAPSIEIMRLEAPPIALSILTKQIAEKGYGKDISFELFAVDDTKPETILVFKNDATKKTELGRIVVAENLSFNFSESISKDDAEIHDSLKLDEISGKVIDAYKRAGISSSLTDPPTPGQIIKNQLIDVLPMDAPAFDIVSPEETTGYIVTDKNHNRLFGFFEEEGGFITLSTQTDGNGGYSAEAGQTFPDYESLSETFSVLLNTLPKFAATSMQPGLAKKNGDIPEQDNIEDQQNENKAKDEFSVPEDSDLHNLLKILPDEVKPIFDEPVGFVTLKNENDLYTVDGQAVLSAENPVIKKNDSQAEDKLDTKIAIAADQYQTQLTEIETRFNEIFVYAKPGEQVSPADVDLPQNSDVTIVGFDESRSVILYSFNDTDRYGVASVSDNLKTYDHSFFDKAEFDKIQETFVYQFDQSNKLKKADENVLSATSLANDIENSDPSLADLLADGKFEETGLIDISEAETFPPIPPIDLELYEQRMAERNDFDPEDENILSPVEVRQDYFEEVLGTAREILELTDFVAAAPQTKKAEQKIKKGNERLNQLRAELPLAISATGFYFGEPSEKYIRSVVKSTGITFDDNYKLQIADKDLAGLPLKLTESSPIKELSGNINESAVAKLALMLHNQSDADEFTYPGEDIRRVSISLPEKIKPFVNAAALVAFPERTGTDAHIGFRLNLGGEVYQHLPNMLDVAERRGSKALGEAADQIREIVKLKWQAAGSPVFHENAFKTEEVTPEMAFAFALDAVEKFERATGGRYDFAPCLAVNREFSDETYKYLNLWEEQTKDNGEKYAELFKVFPKNPANPDLFSENADARRVLNDLIYAGYIEIEQENDKGLFIKTGNPLLMSPDSKESDIRNDESTLIEASENDLKTVESVLNKLNLLDKINSNEDFSERIEVNGLNPLYISREGKMLDLAIYFPDQESVEINYLLKLSVSENGGVRFDEFGFRTSAREDIDRKTLHDDITVEAGKFINDVLIKYEEGVLFVGEATPVKEPKVKLIEVKKESEREIIWKPRPVNLNLIAGIADKSERERHYEIYKDLSRESAVLLTLLQKENNGTIPDSIDPHNLSDKLYFTVRRVGNLYRFTGKKGEDTEVIRIAKEFTYQETAKIAKGKIEEFPVTNPKPETTTLVIATPEVKIKPEKTPESFLSGSVTSDNSRSLLLPEVVDLTVDEQQSYHENKELLAMRGYQTLALSGKTIAIKAIPSTVTPDECKDDFIFLLNNPERIVEHDDIIQGIPVEPISIETALAAWSKPEIQTLRMETAPPIPASAEESRTNEKDHSEHYRWTDPELHNASALQRLRWNIQAIELLRHLNAEYRAPEVEEQDTLARFSGWGSMKPVFDPTQQDKWKDETESLKRLLSESEFQAAESATLNSHFTSPTIVDALWQTAVRLGFRGGKAVEPSVGIGVVLGRIPEHLIPVTKFTAIEKDELTAKLCTKLYQDVVVKHSGYEDHRVPDGWYDLAIGNVPFGSYKVHDERYNKLNANIHDYFLVKSLDQIRGGGIQILITSAGTLDKADDSIRRRIAKEGKLIGAMRLPSGTFKDNAGTEVVTDVLIFQKKTIEERLKDVQDAEGLELANAALTVAQKRYRELTKIIAKAEKADQPEKRNAAETEQKTVQEDINAAEIRITAEKAQLELIYPNWLRLGTARNSGGDEIEINQYFVENPSMIIGNLKLDRGLYHEKEMVVEMTEDFETLLQDAITSLPADIVTERTESVDETLLDRIVTDERVRHGSVIIENGKMYHAEKQAYGEIIYVEKDEVKPAIIARTARLLKIRDAVRNCFNADLQGAPPITTDIIRDHLNIHYDDFVKDYGSLHLPANQKLLAGDPDLHLLLALEDYDKNTKQAVKAAIFREATITSYVPPHRAENMSEAIGITLNEYGKLHVPRIVFLLKKEDEPTTEVFARIEKEFIESGLVYHDPVKEEWITKDEYLAGNVREKHAAAVIAAAENPERYQKAAEELFKVIPTDLDYTEIDVELGVSWLDREDVAAFAAQLVSGEAEDFQVSHTRSSGWIIGYSQQGTRHSYTPTTTEILGTNRMNMIDVMQHLLDGRRITVYDKIRVDGSDRQVINVEATDAANAKARDIQENFLDWIWTDDTRRTRLHRRYNDLFRSEIPVKYDGSHLTFPGMAKEIDGIPLELRTNQKNAVWRAVRTGSLLFQHEAGGGKTYLMVAAAMKMKQLGLLNKPAIAALKTNVLEITNDAEKLYPGIKLISTSDQFETKKRKETVSRIGTNNFDLVILTHDHIDRLPMKPETRARHINEQLEELRSVIVASEKNKSQNRLVSRLKTAQENLESRLKDVLTKTKDESYFEETGIDSLFIDEIHYYKSLHVFSMNTDVKGIPTSTSDRAMNMFARAFYLQERSGGRNFFGATGTSITNTVAELHIWQKFFQREKLEQKGIATFDSWMHQFARTVTKLERTATGAYKQVTRLAEFTNVPELVALTGEFMDIYNIPKDGEFKRPTVEYEIVKTNLSADQMDYIQRLQKRAENLKRGERDNMLAISTDARKLSLDERLVLPHAPDRPDSKVNLLVERVLQNIEEKDWRTQMIFAEMGVHDVVFPDIINKLSEKIPRERIINFAKLSDSQRKTAINSLKSGEALVGLGSTKTLGTGVNAQDKLFAIHNLDTHWIPAYDEQRRKRMERDGNIHYELGEAVKSYYYLTTGGFDEIMYQANARKHAFISTIINAEGDPNKVQFRRMKEVDGEELSYEEIAAVASGNPLILEQLELQRETEDLQRAEKRHRAAQLRLKDDLRLMTEKIEANQGKIEGLQIDYEVYTKHTSEQEQQAEINKVHNQKLKIELNDWRVAQKELVEQGEIDKSAFASESLERDKTVKDNLLPENTFKARLNGKVLNNRTEAAQELRQSLAYVVNPDKLGEYKGFVIETEVARWFEEKRILLNMRGASGLKYEITFATEEGIFQSMESTMRSIPRAIEKFEDERSVASKNITRIESEIGKPFKHKERLVEAKQDLENINFEISIYALSDEEKTEKRALREGIILESNTPTEPTDLNTSTVREPESAENKPTLTAGEILLNDKWEDETAKTKNSKEFLDHYLNAGFGTLVTHLDESGETSYSLRHLVERKEITISLNGTTETALEYLESLVDEKRFTTPASRDIKQKLDDAYHQIEKMTNQAIPEELDWLKTKARNFEKPDDFVSSLIAQTPLKMASTAGAEETPALGAVSTIVKTHGFANVADFWKKANEEVVAAELNQKVKVFETLLEEEREHVQTNYGGNLAKLDETDPFGGRLNKLEGKPLSNYWWMINATGDGQGRVLLNAGGYELVRQTYQSLKINKPKFIGMFNEPDTVEIIMEHLDKMATEKPDYASILGGVAATIGKASRQAEGTVIFIADSRAIAHEDFHAASFIASRGKSLEERHSRFAELVNSPIYKAAKPVLEKEHKTDNNGLCVEELANEFAEENYAKYKATKEEKDEFLKLWFTSFAEKNGILTKKEFKALNEQSRQIRDEAYAAVAVADVSRRIQINQRPAAEYSAETGGQEQETRKPLREISEPESRVKSNSSDNFNPEIREKNTTFRLGVLAKPIEDEASESGLETDADRKYGLPVVAADGSIKVGDRVNYHVGNAKVLEIKENSEGKLYKLKSYANKDEWWTNSDIKQLDRSGATLEDFQAMARQLPDKEFLTAMTPVHWDRARDYGIGSLVTFWEETTGNKFEEIKTPNRWATLNDGEKIPHSSEKNINNTPPDDFLKPDLGVDISVDSPGINEEQSISTNDSEDIPENIEEMLLKNAGNKLEAAYNFVQIELEEDFGIAAYEQKMKSFGFEMHLTDGEPEMFLPTELKNVFINPDKEIVIFEEIENRLIAYPAAESDLKNIYRSGQRDYETESEISGNLDLSDQTAEITDEPELLKAGVTAADEAVLGKNFEIKFEEIKAKYRHKLGLAEAETSGSEINPEPPQPAVIEGGDDLSVLLGQELILRHDLRESEYKLSEWLTEKDFHRVEIDRGSEKDSKVLTSLAELNKEARTLARNKVLELEKAGLLKTEALEVGKEHSEIVKTLFSEMYQAETAAQSAEREQVTKVLDQTASQKQLDLAKKEANWINVLEETKKLSATLGDDAKLVSPKLHPEEIWRWQEKAGFRMDEAGFIELEQLHREIRIPRSQEALGRLRGVEKMADVTARAETKAFENYEDSGIEKATVKVCLKNEKGELIVTQMSLNEADERAEASKTNAKNLFGQSKTAGSEAVKSLFAPIENQINPMSPVAGKLAWFTKPAQTLNYHINPIEIIKYDPGVQVIRAVYNYAKYTKQAFDLDKQAKGEMANAKELTEKVKPEITDALGKIKQEHLETAENAGKVLQRAQDALEWESRVRAKESIADEVFASNLSIPGKNMPVREWKKFGDKAIEIGDHELLKDFQTDMQETNLAEAVGETDSRMVARSIKADVRLADEAKNAIASITKISPTEVELEIKLANLVKFGVADEAAQIAGDALETMGIDAAGAPPIFTSQEELAMRGSIADLETQTAVNLSRILDDPLSAAGNMGNVSNIGSTPSLDFDSMNAGQQQVLEEARQIQTALSEMQNTINVQSLLEQQAQIQMAIPGANQVAADTATNMPTAYTVNQPVMEMSNLEREAIQNMAEAIEKGELAETYTQQQVREAADVEIEAAEIAEFEEGVTLIEGIAAI